MAAGSSKGRRPPKLLLELLVVLVLGASAVVGIYLGFRSPPVHSAWPLGGPNVNVSRNADGQFEVSAGLDPDDANVIVAGSSDTADDARLYESRDGGSSWTSTFAPPFQRGPCGLAHPSVAFGPGRLQVYASLVSETCTPPDPLLHVATRRGTSESWRVSSLAPPRAFAFDQRPSAAVDARGSIYVAWPRLLGEIKSHQILLLSRSDDGGVSWSTPQRIGDYTGAYSLDLVAARPRELYLAVADGKRHRLDLLHSTDGGSSWRARLRLAPLVEPYFVGCGAGAVLLPAQPQRCVGPEPAVASSGNGVTVAYSEPERNGTQAVFSVTADRALRSASAPRRIGPLDRRKSDQFLPVVAYDAARHELWACYYDTLGDSARKHAWFTCTISRDGGRRWARPVHASSKASNETPIAADASGYGEGEALLVANGVAHPMWTDSRNLLDDAEEIYTAKIPASRLRP